MGAPEFWRQFPATISFLEPCTIVGTVERLSAFENRDGGFPQVHLRLDNEMGVIVNVTQARLLAEFVRLLPDVGDRIRIRYTGQSSKAAPGLSPTKEFTLEVQKAGSQPQGRPDGTSGDTSENDPEAGT